MTSCQDETVIRSDLLRSNREQQWLGRIRGNWRMSEERYVWHCASKYFASKFCREEWNVWKIIIISFRISEQNVWTGNETRSPLQDMNAEESMLQTFSFNSNYLRKSSASRNMKDEVLVSFQSLKLCRRMHSSTAEIFSSIKCQSINAKFKTSFVY